MDVIREHLKFLKETSWFVLFNLKGGQDSLKRFIYCCTDKINKCTIALEELYDLLTDKKEIEFSIGIIVRSLLMDCILIQYLRYLTLQVEVKGNDFVKKEIDKYTLMFIADGTSYMINDFYGQENITAEKKKEIGQKLSSIFPGLFENDANGKPVLKSEFKLNLKNIYTNSEHPDLLTRKTVYNLYLYYSKYDHLSHWTSFFGTEVSFKERKKKIDSSIAMILYNFRDLMIISRFHTEIKDFFLPTIKNLDTHIKECYPEFNSDSIKD